MIDPYVDPGSGVLWNHFDLDDEERLARIERVVSFDAMTRILAAEVDMPRADLEALQSVHYELFHEVYPFAGQLRTVEVSKTEARLSGRSVRYAVPDVIEAAVADGARAVRSADICEGSSPAAWRRLAEGFAAIWRAHPFREGNTRAVMVLAETYLRGRGVAVDFEILSRDPKETRDLFVKAAEGYGHGVGDLLLEARRSYRLRSHPVFGLLSSDAADMLRAAAGGRDVPSRLASEGDVVRGRLLFVEDGIAVLETPRGFVGFDAAFVPRKAMPGERLSLWVDLASDRREGDEASVDLEALAAIRRVLLSDPDGISVDPSAPGMMTYDFADSRMRDFADANPRLVSRVAMRILGVTEIENWNEWARAYGAAGGP